MLTVVHAIDSLRLGGAESLLSALVRQLAADGATRNVVVSPAEGADPGLVEAIGASADDLVLVDAERLADGRLLRALARTIHRRRASLVHSHLSNANVTSRIAARALSRPHVTTLHTMPGPTAEDNRTHAALDGWSARLSTVLVAPATEIAEATSAMYRVPASRFRVINNAPAASPVPAGFDREAARRALVGDAAGPVVVCVARLQAEKGIDELIEATAALREELPGLRVVVVGGGPEEERLRALVAERGVEDAMLLLGRRSDVGELLAVADLFCLPSRHEGLPLSVLEAMTAGLPVVATAVGGLPSLLTDGEDGLLVAPRDPAALAAALRRALTDDDLARRIAAAGQALVSREHSLAAVARRYAELYRELAGA